MALLVMGALVAPPAQAAADNSISGVLRDSNGAPITSGDFEVTLEEQENGDIDHATVGAGESEYSFENLPDGGLYNVRVFDKNGLYASVRTEEFTLSGGQSLRRDFDLVVAGSVEVTLRGPGGSAFPAGESGWVSLVRSAPAGPSGLPWTSGGVEEVSGPSVSFDRLTPGTYMAKYRSDREKSDKYGAMSTSFTVAAGSTPASVELTMEELGVIRGSVRLPAGMKASAYAEVDVELHSGVWDGTPIVELSSSGSYSVKTLANDPVLVHFDSDIRTMADAYWDGSRYGTPVRADAERVTVAPGATVNRDITLRPTGTHGLPLIEKTASPKITGRKRVGEVLSVSAGSWNVAGVITRYQWYRNGTKIAGADEPRYRLRISDRKAKVRARVLVTKPGYDSGVAYAAKVGPFAIALSRMTYKTKVLPNHRAAVVVQVNTGIAPSRLTGKITFRSGKKVLRAAKVSGSKVGFKVGGLKKGTHKYRLVYSGNKHVKASMRWVRLTVS
ncbi:carboxypeptidase-like regulatory domain-containing protein [Aeromicrobium sp.]|uniref:carboxypeptidase-like regulatory domain-containing protein n=1 Tax=Aeromicrobium sp. TaxID=1871063 RepID=UPI0028B12A29|nr:carboxypeptidase-like regulatory domain-containing protein [Aeromicrobium sp.]